MSKKDILAYVLVDENLSQRLNFYLSKWGLRYNPFAYQKIIEELYDCKVCLRILVMFINAYINARKVFYITWSDLKKLVPKITYDEIRVALRHKVLMVVKKNGKVYYGLHKDIASVLW